MLVLLYCLAALALLLVVIYVWGRALPPGHRAVDSIELPLASDDVWRIVTDYAAMPAWRQSLEAIRRDPAAAGREVWIEREGKREVAYETIEQQAPVRLVRRIATPNLPYSGRWIFELQPTVAGCRLTLTEEGEIHPPIFRFVAKYLRGYHHSIQAFLRDLQARTQQPPHHQGAK